MSRFSADWLTLREEADHRARDRTLLEALRARLADGDAVRVVDLGCGTGSNLRATAPHLPGRQLWRLLDHDPALLAAARERLADWADSATRAGDRLQLVKGDRELEVTFHQGDLAADLDEALGAGPDLVTAAALFDLVSAPWIERFARAVACRGSVFYTALTYDGTKAWAPAHPADEDIHAAFLVHQRRDKSFGPSVGPAATDVLGKALFAQGYEVTIGHSPWRLGPEDGALIAELARGVAEAVRETGAVPDESAAQWLAARLQGASCTVGHADLLAVPPRITARGAAPAEGRRGPAGA